MTFPGKMLYTFIISFMSILASLPNHNNTLKAKLEIQGIKCVTFSVMLLINSVTLIYVSFPSIVVKNFYFFFGWEKDHALHRSEKWFIFILPNVQSERLYTTWNTVLHILLVINSVGYFTEYAVFLWQFLILQRMRFHCMWFSALHIMAEISLCEMYSLIQQGI
jgi:hypothetical protein